MLLGAFLGGACIGGRDSSNAVENWQNLTVRADPEDKLQERRTRLRKLVEETQKNMIREEVVLALEDGRMWNVVSPPDLKQVARVIEMKTGVSASITGSVVDFNKIATAYPEDRKFTGRSGVKNAIEVFSWRTPTAFKYYSKCVGLVQTSTHDTYPEKVVRRTRQAVRAIEEWQQFQTMKKHNRLHLFYPAHPKIWLAFQNASPPYPTIVTDRAWVQADPEMFPAFPFHLGSKGLVSLFWATPEGGRFLELFGWKKPNTQQAKEGAILSLAQAIALTKGILPWRTKPEAAPDTCLSAFTPLTKDPGQWSTILSAGACEFDLEARRFRRKISEAELAYLSGDFQSAGSVLSWDINKVVQAYDKALLADFLRLRFFVLLEKGDLRGLESTIKHLNVCFLSKNDAEMYVRMLSEAGKDLYEKIVSKACEQWQRSGCAKPTETSFQ